MQALEQGEHPDEEESIQFWRHPINWFSRRRRHEADCLRAKIVKKAAKEVERDEKELHCFLEHRFEEPLVKYGRRGPLYGRAFTILSVTVVAAGFGSSAISATNNDSDALRWVIFSLGVLVSLFTAINQLWKPGLRSISSYRASNALRREGWDYVYGRGRYASSAQTAKGTGWHALFSAGTPESSKAFDDFVDQIREIQSQIDAIDEVQAEVVHTPDAGS